MIKIYVRVAGNTLGFHQKLIKKYKKKGVKVVKSPEDSDLTIVFCPIVSRFETDVNEALSSLSERETAIVVAMHHTFDPNYALPSHRHLENHRVVLLVDVLFFETQGLLKCPCNKSSKKKVYKELEAQKKKKSKQGQHSGTSGITQTTSAESETTKSTSPKDVTAM